MPQNSLRGRSLKKTFKNFFSSWRKHFRPMVSQSLLRVPRSSRRVKFFKIVTKLHFKVKVNLTRSCLGVIFADCNVFIIYFLREYFFIFLLRFSACYSVQLREISTHEVTQRKKKLWLILRSRDVSSLYLRQLCCSMRERYCTIITSRDILLFRVVNSISLNW